MEIMHDCCYKEEGHAYHVDRPEGLKRSRKKRNKNAGSAGGPNRRMLLRKRGHAGMIHPKEGHAYHVNRPEGLKRSEEKEK